MSETKSPYDAILASAGNKKLTFFFTQQDVFSQWHPSIFEDKGVVFTSAEMYMMFKKAELFKDGAVAEKIKKMNNIKVVKDFISGKLTVANLLSNNPVGDYLNDSILSSVVYSFKLLKIKTMAHLWGAIQGRVKAYGKEVSNFNKKIWLENREPIVLSGSYLKYEQNVGMKALLMATKGTVLVEASPWDEIYGVGLAKTDRRIKNPSQWLGLNLLGKALTNLRYYLTDKIAIKEMSLEHDGHGNPLCAIYFSGAAKKNDYYDATDFLSKGEAVEIAEHVAKETGSIVVWE